MKIAKQGLVSLLELKTRHTYNSLSSHDHLILLSAALQAKEQGDIVPEYVFHKLYYITYKTNSIKMMMTSFYLYQNGSDCVYLHKNRCSYLRADSKLEK